MSNVNEPIRFGDVVKLQTKSAFIENATPACLGFLELPGKASTQLLVVPPVKDEVNERFLEAEFIIAPIRGEKQQVNGIPLTYHTPFVLRTSDGKDGSTYSLNNKVTGQREGISLQVSASKGEMYIQVEKQERTHVTGLYYGEDGLHLHVVDSNRVRKSLNHLLTHVVKPKSDMLGGIVTCGSKGSALTFSFQRAVDTDGNVKTETMKYVKNPQARRSSIDTLSPGKMDELGRADRIDSSEFSDVDAMSRSSSVAGLSSNPASPRSSSVPSGLTTPVDGAAVAARLSVVKNVEATASSSASSSSYESSLSAPATSTESKSVDIKTSARKPETKKTDAVIVKASPVKTKPVKAVPAKTEPTQTEQKAETAPDVATSKPVKTATKAAAKAAPVAVKTVLADASTFPPTPAINGPAPVPVVVSPKAASLKSTPKTTTDASKVIKEEEVATLKAEAEVENLEPACGAKCSVM